MSVVPRRSPFPTLSEEGKRKAKQERQQALLAELADLSKELRIDELERELKALKAAHPKPIYFESHVTIEPVFDARLWAFQKVAGDHQFRVAELLMQKRSDDVPEASRKDAFCTGRGDDYNELETRMLDLVRDLRVCEFEVLRYKVEAVVFDSKRMVECAMFGCKELKEPTAILCDTCEADRRADPDAYK